MTAPTRRRRWGVLVATLIGALAGWSGSAAAVEHVVREGESFSDIAQAYYAEPKLGALVAAANARDSKTPPPPATRLIIPHASAYKIRAGDNWKGLATRHLGDERRAPMLARANGFTADSEPPPGAVIFLPFHVERTADKKDSFKSLAELFYDDGRKADSIRDYNLPPAKRKKATRPRPGELVIIPIFHARVRPEKLRAPSAVATDHGTKDGSSGEPDVGRTLALAEGFWSEGLYARVVTTLTPLLSSTSLQPKERRRVLELTGASLVALGDEAAAVDTYRALLTHDPDYRPDPDRTSPKILKVIDRARE